MIEGVICFPAYATTEEGFCSCKAGKDCKQGGFHPKVRWKNRTESHPIKEGDKKCILTGAVSGFFAVDIDTKNGKDGDTAWKVYCAGREVPETYTVRTKSGGYHLYFKHPGFPVHTGKNIFGEGVDVRGDGGIVIAPPTKGYTVEKNIPIAVAPDWLLVDSRLRGKEVKAEFEYESTLTPEEVAIAVSRAKRWIDNEAPESIEGQGGDVECYKVASQIVSYYRVPPAEALNLLTYWSDRKAKPPWGSAELIHKVQCAMREEPAIQFFVNKIEEKKDIAEALAKPSKSTKHKTDPGHTYSFIPGQRSGVHLKLEPLSLNDLVANLRGAWPEWKGVFQYNEFKDLIVAVNPPVQLDAEGIRSLTDADLEKTRCWINDRGFEISTETAYKAVLTVARTNLFHPVKEYFDSLPKAEGTKYIDTFSSSFFGNDTSICNVFMRKFFIAAVARIMDPGCKVDTALVLYGKQGGRKSTFVETIFGAENYTANIPDLNSKDSLQALIGQWGIEIAEMEKVLRTDDNVAKAFISTRVDRFRSTYGKCVSNYPRTSVLVGTSNDEEILQDATGARRYWPIEVKVELIQGYDRDIVWSEAYHEYLRLTKAGADYIWHLTPEEEEVSKEAKEPFQMVDPWLDRIEKYLCGKKSITSEDAYVDAICSGDSKSLVNCHQGIKKRIGKVLRRLGCVPTMKDKKRTWAVPLLLQNSASSDLLDIARAKQPN